MRFAASASIWKISLVRNSVNRSVLHSLSFTMSDVQSSNSSEVVVCAVGELLPGGRREVDIGDRYRVCVFNVNGEVVALRNLCPHQGGALGLGFVGPLVTADSPGKFHYEREGEILHCPVHQWEFDLKTGCALQDPRLCTKTYRVSVRNDQIILHT